MEDKINKILMQTEGINQIKVDLKKLNELAEKTKGGHDILLDIQAKLDTYRNDSDKLTGEVEKNTKDIESLKCSVKNLKRRIVI